MEELHDYVMSRMPVLARLVGRDAVADIVRRAVAAWPCDEMAACGQDRERQRAILRGVRQRVAREGRYGNPILIMWGISIIINLIWQWWLSRHRNQEVLAQWKTAMEAGS